MKKLRNGSYTLRCVLYSPRLTIYLVTKPSISKNITINFMKCRYPDSNREEQMSANPSSLCVYQFHHSGTFEHIY